MIIVMIIVMIVVVIKNYKIKKFFIKFILNVKFWELTYPIDLLSSKLWMEYSYGISDNKFQKCSILSYNLKT